MKETKPHLKTTILTFSQKRSRREYRQQRRAAFTRPEPGFSLYEGRTRGKRMRYTYDDDDVFLSDATSARRSARQSARNTPFESGPTTTASGRQIRQPRQGDYGESLLSGPPLSTDELAPEYTDGEGVRSRARSGTEDSEEPVRAAGRATRSAARPAVNGAGNPRKRKHIDTYNGIDEWSDEEDAEASAEEWDSDKNQSEDEHMPDADEEDDAMSEADDESEVEDGEPASLVVRLRIPAKSLSRFSTPGPTPSFKNGAATPLQTVEDSAQAGAPKCEPGEEPKLGVSAPVTKVEAPQPQQQWSSPTGPSSYPTPTSSSFLPAEQKSTIASAPALPQSGLEFQSTKQGPSNGVLHPSALKRESDPPPPGTKFERLPQPWVNSVQPGYSN